MLIHLTHLGSPRHLQKQMFLGVYQHTDLTVMLLLCVELVLKPTIYTVSVIYKVLHFSKLEKGP